MTWTDEFATAVRELYREQDPGTALSAQGVELSLGRPVYKGKETAPVKVLVEQAWIDGAMRHGLTPWDGASVLVDRIIELLSKPPGEGPIGLKLLAGRPAPPGPRLGHVMPSMYFSIPRPNSSSGQGDPEKPSMNDNSG